MRAIEGLDLNVLDQAGWGLVFPANLDASTVDQVHKHLYPLLEMRQEQAGRFFRVFAGRDGVRPDESAVQFLNRYGAGYGSVDPSAVPYYLLLASRPDQISYEFQQRLSVQHAVGRIWFDSPDAWQAYADTVRRAEVSHDDRPAGLQIFTPLHPNDPFSTRLQGFAQQLAGDLAGNLRSWQVAVQPQERCKRADLIRLIRSAEARVLVLAGHSLNGAFVCAGWAGPEGRQKRPSLRNVFHSGSVPDDADLRGLVIIQYATDSVGTALGAETSKEAEVLLSLSEGRGAQAVAGWVGQVWGPTTRELQARELAVFSNSLQRLASGCTLGYALSLFPEQYAGLVSELNDAWEDIEYGLQPDETKLADLWAGMTTARGLTIIGDPAIRLPAVQAPEPAANLLASLTAPNIKQQYDNVTRSGAVNVLDLEISLSRSGIAAYDTVFQMSSTASGGTARAGGRVTLDFNRLQFALRSSEEYASSLTQQVFADSTLRRFAAEALALAQTMSQELRIRIAIHQNAPELHDVKWELLCEPERGAQLAAMNGVTFTRYLMSAGWSAIRIQPQRDMRVLVAVFDPIDADRYNIPAVDMNSETALLNSIYDRFNPVMLTGSSGRRATLQSFMEMMQTGVDVVHVKCISRQNRSDGQIQLMLSDEEGRTMAVSAGMFSAMIKELTRTPRLMILHADQPGSLAVQLAVVGVPAVLFIPDGMPAETIHRWLTIFLDTVRESGRVDLAASRARSTLRDQEMSWMPVLYTRMREGRIFSEPARY